MYTILEQKKTFAPNSIAYTDKEYYTRDLLKIGNQQDIISILPISRSLYNLYVDEDLRKVKYMDNNRLFHYTSNLDIKYKDTALIAKGYNKHNIPYEYISFSTRDDAYKSRMYS